MNTDRNVTRVLFKKSRISISPPQNFLGAIQLSPTPCGGCLIAITAYLLPIESSKRNLALVLPISDVLKGVVIRTVVMLTGPLRWPPLPPGTESRRCRCRMGTVIKTASFPNGVKYLFRGIISVYMTEFGQLIFVFTKISPCYAAELNLKPR